MSSSANKTTLRKRGTGAAGAAKRGVAEPSKRSASELSKRSSVTEITKRSTSGGITKRSNIVTTRSSVRQAEAVADGSNCIDLTCECDDEIVDLTNVDMSPINLNYQSIVRTRRSILPRVESASVPSASSIQPLSICLLDDCEHYSGKISPDLPEVDFGQYSRKEPVPTRESFNNRVISCPICFDTDQEISKSGNHLTSTTCGHIFCNNCISESIQKNRCCPTCRKRLTARQIHPIFL